MAEQFLLPDAKSKAIKAFLKTVKCTITDLAHAHVGWNATSRAAYNGMMGLPGGAAAAVRTNLPPHFYIEIPVNTYVAAQDGTDLVRSLSRGRVPTLLKALDKTSQEQWNEGRIFEALNTELKKGNVSICIYHLDGTEVGQTERDTVNGYPKKA